MDNNIKVFISVIVLLVVGVISTVIMRGADTTTASPGKYDELATCIKDSGAQFYGAFWCPHCQNQKKMFGSSAKLLPYVECSTPDGRGQLAVCRDAGVTGYPWWVFKDGSTLGGEVSINQLAEKTGCFLPAEEITQ